MKYKVYVDGQEGTTGLKINERLEARDDIEILKISSEKRKDSAERAKFINEADVVFLCLPDAASIEAVSFMDKNNTRTRVIDASTAFRTDDSWAYGLPEISSEQREKIAKSRFVANPGCYATGFNLIAHPLVKGGIISADYPITCHAVSGYSGAGKKAVEQYESEEGTTERMKSPRFYGLPLKHKHLPEMKKVSGLTDTPIFSPIITSVYQGMIVAIPIFTKLMENKMNPFELHKFISEYYNGQKFIKVMPFDEGATYEEGLIDVTGCNNTNEVQIFVYGNDDKIIVLARLDNLGKGASGAAVQNMNIMLGLDETIGLV
jgi:N-acetyl-gamma-glutamyl-phosphate reductase